MKKLLTGFLVLTVLALSFSSCKDDENGPSGKFTFDGESFKLSRGFASFEDSYPAGDDTYYEWSIYLTSSSIDFDETEEDFAGTGDALILTIYALNDDSFVPPGTYEYSEETADGSIYIGFDVSDGDPGEAYNDVDDATITITKSGNTYTINFTITLADATVVTGSYKGSIKEIDY